MAIITNLDNLIDTTVAEQLDVLDATLTTLALDTNTLSYKDEKGDTTSIDLSKYIDDTNLARITKSELNTSNGIVTFTRDDDSTFTLDLHDLFIPADGGTDGTDGTDGLLTDSDKFKLDGIEDSATADQTDSEIKTAYENNSNTNAYIDSDKTKVDYIGVTQAVDLDTIESDTTTNNAKETNVTTNISISKTATVVTVESSDGSNGDIAAANSTDAGIMSKDMFSKLDSIEANAEVNVQADWANTDTASDGYVKNKPFVAAKVQNKDSSVIYDDSETDKNYRLRIINGDIALEEL